ncbi:hypothetical protein HPB47_009688 [Ixodes persulcatus]|uniref:Uncharacterized protein n=1 Tax=Ixodes persulcatus TaxID=34615 RepID=A0AC60P1G2_IXOPE|nr:hypothetical protein HPB47_009688 [Ixodes persulcatus]
MELRDIFSGLGALIWTRDKKVAEKTGGYDWPAPRFKCGVGQSQPCTVASPLECRWRIAFAWPKIGVVLYLRVLHGIDEQSEDLPDGSFFSIAHRALVAEMELRDIFSGLGALIWTRDKKSRRKDRRLRLAGATLQVRRWPITAVGLLAPTFSPRVTIREGGRRRRHCCWEARTSTNMTSDIESSNAPMSIDMAEAQASTSTIIKDGYEIPPIDCTAETMSSSSSTIVSSNDELHSDDGDYEVVHGKKRRKTSQSSASHSKENTNLQVGFTVLYMPTDTSKVASLSKFKLTDYLNNVAPGMVSVVRINKARNIVAVDVKKPALKAELLKLTKLCALPVRAFLPSDRTNCYGVLRDIDPDCTEQDIKTRLQSTACITDVKRLGKTSPVVRKKPSYVLGVDNATTTSVKSIPAASIVKEITPPTHLSAQ